MQVTSLAFGTLLMMKHGPVTETGPPSSLHVVILSRTAFWITQVDIIGVVGHQLYAIQRTCVARHHRSEISNRLARP